MTHNSSPEFYAAAESADAHARETLGTDYADMEQPRESRRFISESDMDLASPQDWRDLQTVLDWETFEGMGS